jgi:hypothetical protein
MSSNQLHRTLGVTLKTAWFMSHRIREAMVPGGGGLLGGGGGIVEVDETYYGIKDSVRKPGRRTKGTRRDRIHAGDKRAIVALVERDGEVRAFHVPDVTSKTLKTVLSQVSRDAHLMTDEATRYWNVGKEFAKHSSVNHSKGEYARGERQHEPHGRLFRRPQAWPVRNVSARFRASPSTLCDRVCVPL